MAKKTKQTTDRMNVRPENDDRQAEILDVQSAPEIEDTPSIPGGPDDKPVPDRQISLARANKLRNSISKAIEKVAVQLQTVARNQVTIFPGESQKDLDRKIDDVKAEIKVLSNNLGVLNNIGTALREDIARANVESGVSAVMGTIAKVKTIIDVYTPIYSGVGRNRYGVETEVRSDSQVKFAFARQKNAMDNPGMSIRPESFDVPIYTREDVQKEAEGLQGLEKHIQDLEEQRNVINYSTTIAISEEVCKWLEQAKLL